MTLLISLFYFFAGQETTLGVCAEKQEIVKLLFLHACIYFSAVRTIFVGHTYRKLLWLKSSYKIVRSG